MLEAACALRDAPDVGDVTGVEFDGAEITVLG
ncbi:ABC transporter ATP-binding protein OS=Streptomyces tendae OX=1932 GN=F3L20_07415 PE=4 SV=1 [Streptomyces tendae]